MSTTNYIKYFYYVAKTLSFSEASKCLYISQSAVSQSVKVLEKKLGQTLFIRSTKTRPAHPEGDILFKHIEPAMNLIHKGETQLLEANTLNGGQLRIAARHDLPLFPGPVLK
ncbi:MAG: LysR family transcriptional regulator [Pilosibacter sp.]